MNFEALHRTFVKQWEIAIFAMEKQKNKNKYFGSKHSSYDLKLYPHIEEDHTNIVFFAIFFCVDKDKKFKIYILDFCLYN